MSALVTRFGTGFIFLDASSGGGYITPYFPLHYPDCLLPLGLPALGARDAVDCGGERIDRSICVPCTFGRVNIGHYEGMVKGDNFEIKERIGLNWAGHRPGRRAR